MLLNREEFLTELQTVQAGLSPREFLEQSSCFVFKDGQVMTFNDEVACRRKTDLLVTGAVQAVTLLAILEKLTDEELEVEESGRGELVFSAKKKRFAVTKDAEIFLPIDRVKLPKQWEPIPKGVMQAIQLVQHCVSRDESRFLLTCIHLHPDYVEACDNYQVMRYHVKTGLEGSVLVRGTSLVALAGRPQGRNGDGVETGLGMNQFAMTPSWLHFRNKEGLIHSCRRYVEDYPSLDKLIEVKGGHSITIPKGLAEANERAAIFASDKSGDPIVGVRIENRRLRVRGSGLSGRYEEIRPVAYDGPPIKFYLDPDLLHHISQTSYEESKIAERRFHAAGPNWEYTSVLGMKPTPPTEETKGKE